MTTRRSGQSAQRVTSLGSVAEPERTGSKGRSTFLDPCLHKTRLLLRH
jgi:hypothetical protein